MSDHHTPPREEPSDAAVNRELPRLLFLHIAKTAGTSLVEYLRNRLPPGSVLSHGDFLALPGQRLTPQVIARHHLVSGHFGYSDIRPYLAGNYSLTFLRDPLERVLSLYRYLQNPGMQEQFAVARTAADLTVDQFMTSTRGEVVEMLDNQQTWQLADNYWMSQRRQQALRSDEQLLSLATAHLAEFSKIGFTDTFAGDFRELITLMGLPKPDHVPRQLHTQNPLHPGDLSAASLSALEDRLALDRALVDHARTLRAEPGTSG